MESMWQAANVGGLEMENSCFASWQLLQLADGTLASAEEIYRRLLRWETPEVSVFDPMLCAPCYVVGGARTKAPGVRIIFDDGTSVDLTEGHVLYAGIDDRGSDSVFDMPIKCHSVVAAGEVALGMRLGEKVVASVTRIGEIDAIRLWTDRPEWILAAGGIPVGTRWHEIIPAWGPVDQQHPEWDEFQEYWTMTSIRGFVFPPESEDDGYDGWKDPRCLGDADHIVRSTREYSWPWIEGGALQWCVELIDGPEVVMGTGIGDYYPDTIPEWKARYVSLAERPGLELGLGKPNETEVTWSGTRDTSAP